MRRWEMMEIMRSPSGIVIKTGTTIGPDKRPTTTYNGLVHLKSLVRADFLSNRWSGRICANQTVFAFVLNLLIYHLPRWPNKARPTLLSAVRLRHSMMAAGAKHRDLLAGRQAGSASRRGGVSPSECPTTYPFFADCGPTRSSPTVVHRPWSWCRGCR
jgi:hypothetical protein